MNPNPIVFVDDEGLGWRRSDVDPTSFEVVDTNAEPLPWQKDLVERLARGERLSFVRGRRDPGLAELGRISAVAGLLALGGPRAVVVYARTAAQARAEAEAVRRVVDEMSRISGLDGAIEVIEKSSV